MVVVSFGTREAATRALMRSWKAEVPDERGVDSLGARGFRGDAASSSGCPKGASDARRDERPRCSGGSADERRDGALGSVRGSLFAVSFSMSSRDWSNCLG